MFYDLVLKRFKQSCADNGVIDMGSPSLEDCVLGLRQALRAMGGTELTLSNTEGFIELQHSMRHDDQVRASATTPQKLWCSVPASQRLKRFHLSRSKLEREVMSTCGIP